MGWLQSRLRRPEARETLFDLERVRATVTADAQRLLLQKTVANLLRMWGE